jgi:nucleoside-diphosphate-sugar epimerase
VNRDAAPIAPGETVLVTGGAGFIGSHLVDALLARGARVRVLDDLSNGKRANLEHVASRIDFVRADVRDAGACREACVGAALVFHQAALGSVPRSMKDPATSLGVNVSGTANVFAAARDTGARRVVYASSSSVYGDSTRLPKREGEEGRPLSPYALSKVMNEDLAEIFGRCYGMQLIGLRYFNVFGPRQDPEGPYAAVIAVEANLCAAEAPVSGPGRAYNVAGGQVTSVNDLAAAVRAAVGEGPKPRFEAPRPGDVLHSAADLDLARRELDYRPAVGIVDGLAKSLDYYRSLAGARV